MENNLEKIESIIITSRQSPYLTFEYCEGDNYITDIKPKWPTKVLINNKDSYEYSVYKKWDKESFNKVMGYGK